MNQKNGDPLRSRVLAKKLNISVEATTAAMEIVMAAVVVVTVEKDENKVAVDAEQLLLRSKVLLWKNRRPVIFVHSSPHTVCPIAFRMGGVGGLKHSLKLEFSISTRFYMVKHLCRSTYLSIQLN